jgi:hypothetical protein
MEKARERYELAPREFDEGLELASRGDRGCLGDSISGVGAIATLGLGVGAAAGLLPLLAPFFGITLLVVGYVLSSGAQRRSSDERAAVLEAAPLLAVHLVSPPVGLFESSRAVVRAVGVFSTAEARRFDDAYLRKVGEALIAAKTELPANLAALFEDEFAAGFHPVGAALGGEPDTYAARVVVYHERLVERRLAHDAPEIACIVDVPGGFIEHV